MENLKLTIKTCAQCPFRLYVGKPTDDFIDERCSLVTESNKNIEYGIVPPSRDSICPLPLKIRFEI